MEGFFYNNVNLEEIEKHIEHRIEQRLSYDQEFKSALLAYFYNLRKLNQTLIDNEEPTIWEVETYIDQGEVLFTYIYSILKKIKKEKARKQLDNDPIRRAIVVIGFLKIAAFVLRKADNEIGRKMFAPPDVFNMLLNLF